MVAYRTYCLRRQDALLGHTDDVGAEIESVWSTSVICTKDKVQSAVLLHNVTMQVEAQGAHLLPL